MTKTLRQIEEQLKLIDLIIEIVDARIPASSRNPELNRLAGGRSRMVLFGKTDLADPVVTEKWMELYRSQGIYPYACDLRDSHALKKLTPVIREVCREKIERDRRKGIMNRPIRAMAAGIPNVGKSTFINSFSGSSSLKTGNKPGVTKGKQWIRISKEVELMDTPGLLWPKFEDQSVGLKIALIGSMPDTILNTEELSLELIHVLAERYEGALASRYGIDESGLAENERLGGIEGRDGGDACDDGDACDGGNVRDGRDGGDACDGGNVRDGRDGVDACDGVDVRVGRDGVDACDGGDVRVGRVGADGGDSKRNHMAAIGVLTEIAKNRGCLKKGGEPDTEKAALLLLDDFRSGRLGRMSLESPEEMAK